MDRLAEEQAALRRVATLVAQGMPSGALFSVVCDEVEALAGAHVSAVVRFEADGTVTLMGRTHSARHPVGARLELDPDYVVAEVHRTGRAARFDTDDPAAPGMPEVVRAERVMRFRTFLGAYVYHCHILAHEDAGMMGVIDVTRSGRRPSAQTLHALAGMRRTMGMAATGQD